MARERRRENQLTHSKRVNDIHRKLNDNILRRSLTAALACIANGILVFLFSLQRRLLSVAAE